MVMARHLFIVSRDHTGLYHDLVERFRDDKNVQVILDRRRDGGNAASDSERREGERRSRSEIDEELRTRSHVIVTLSDSDANLSLP